MKNSKLFALGFFALVVALFLIGSAFAGGGDPRPVLRAVPAQSTWIADGMTQYSIIIEGDSTPMNGVGTRAIQMGYSLPQAEGYTFNLVGATLRPANDFFTGYNTQDGYDSSLVTRSMLTPGTGPVNRIGNVVELKFTVTQNIVNRAVARQASLSFDESLNDQGYPMLTYFLRHGFQGQVARIAPQIESVPFTVEPRFRSVAVHAALVQCDPQDC
jgi:hypothetical protein